MSMHLERHCDLKFHLCHLDFAADTLPNSVKSLGTKMLLSQARRKLLNWHEQGFSSMKEDLSKISTLKVFICLKNV